MITDFNPILTRSEVDKLVSKLGLLRQFQGLEQNIDEILYLVAFARKLKTYSPEMLTFMLVTNCWLDVDLDSGKVNIVALD